ncbi:MAG: hypothetical protein ACOC97_05545 [Myxococcota bacterium]
MLLAVVRHAPGGDTEVVCDRATITRIGRGVDRTGELAPEGIARTLDVLRAYREEARRLGAERLAAVGTSALRDARNGHAFLEPAAAILGSPVEVITGEREAQLTFVGATHGLGLEQVDVTVVDVGGGSTELVRGRGHRAREAISIDIGSVRAFERHVHDDPPTEAQLAAAAREAERTLRAANVRPEPPLIGIAGTVTTLSSMLQELPRYEPDRIHGSRIARAPLDTLIERMVSRTTEQRARMPGLDPGRADVIATGAILVRTIMVLANTDELIVSTGGVRMGLADELLRSRHPRPTPAGAS